MLPLAVLTFISLIPQAAIPDRRPEWIWLPGEALDDQEVRFSAWIDLAAPPERATLFASADNEFELSINGEAKNVAVEARTTLLAALRDRVDPPHTGAKLVCNQGNCGACTVLIDGRPAYSCMQLACELEGAEIRTVEGLEQNGELSAVQRAFVTEDALMCGFCTPGFVMSVTSCLERDPQASEADVRAACSGNLCRCGTYPHIWRAAEAARQELAGGGK